jgi:hypothetical protein
VLVDVVYNHFANEAARAGWEYDSDSSQPEQYIYY